MHTNRKLVHTKHDIVVEDKKKKVLNIDPPSPFVTRSVSEVEEKVYNYGPFKLELAALSKLKISIIPVVIGAIVR